MNKLLTCIMFFTIHSFYASDDHLLNDRIQLNLFDQKAKTELANELGCYFDFNDKSENKLSLYERKKLFDRALDDEDLESVMAFLLDFSINSKGSKTGNTPLIVLVKKASDIKADELFTNAYKKYTKTFIKFGALLYLHDSKGFKASDWASECHKEYLLPLLLKKV